MALGLLPYILGGTLQEGFGLLSESPLLFKALFCFASSDVSFVLHLVEKELEWVALPTALLIFRSQFVKKF